jgi:uncharacterized membrane protein YbaN (DUF454 family)
MEKRSEKQQEAERMRDVLILLEHLVQNEAMTAKLILACLYDVGAVNLINQKVSHRSLNKITKYIARLSKPIFLILALRWFQKNSPQLIATWLHSQVTFKPAVAQKEIEYVRQNSPIEPVDLKSSHQKEIKLLRSQVRVLTGTSIVAIAAFLSSMVMWLQQNPRAEIVPLQETTKKAIVNQ